MENVKGIKAHIRYWKGVVSKINRDCQRNQKAPFPVLHYTFLIRQSLQLIIT